PKRSPSIRCISVVFIVLAASAVRWQVGVCVNLNLLGIPPISGLTSGHLIGCWRNALREGKWMGHGELGRPAEIYSIGGCRMVCCWGRLNWRDWNRINTI